MFFFTLVTFDRRPILVTDLARQLLHDALTACAARWPFTIDAIVLLPDHLHAIWTLPFDDADFSRRWAFVKRSVSAGLLSAQPKESAWQPRWQRRRSVWQPRFMEHAIRDETDRDRHLDYLHFNPVKHGHALCPHAWAWSSFHRLVRQKVYPADWACVCERPAKVPDFKWADRYPLE